MTLQEAQNTKIGDRVQWGQSKDGWQGVVQAKGSLATRILWDDGSVYSYLNNELSHVFVMWSNA